LGWLVDRTESIWYSHHQPPRGGTPKGGIARVAPPTVAAAVVPRRGRSVAPAPLVCPAPVRPFTPNAIAGEGLWQSAGRSPRTVCFTYLRPDAVHTSVLVGVAWMNMRVLTATLHNGTAVPMGHGRRGR
jgi:hypothetical protein